MPGPMHPSHPGNDPHASHSPPLASEPLAPLPAPLPSPAKQACPDQPSLEITLIDDPFTTNIIHDTTDSKLVQIMAKVADAGADAGAAVDAASSSRSSTARSSVSSSISSRSATTTANSGLRLSSSTEVSPAPRASINNPLPTTPIALHHALDGTLPNTPAAQPSDPSKVLPRSIDTSVQDTLAKDSAAPIPGSNGRHRIMTPTSRLAETAVGVREVSKKIGRARVKWETPRTVMIVTKPGDESLLKITREISLWMIRSRRLTVYVDEKLRDVPKFRYPAFLKSTKRGYDCTEGLKFWTSDLCEQEAHLFDFAITLGGDGTVLFTSWLFQKIVPPILPFSAGSLGFLTPFPTTDYQEILSTCLDRGVRVNLRMRFSCTIYRCLEHRTVDTTKKKKRRGHRYRDKTRSPSEQVDESDEDSDTRSGMALPTVLTTPTETFEVLNDLVLDRGPSASLSLLELFGDEEHLTTVQADGIVISTPTGSTAYSLAAGGPLTHPEIPSILISPICPHTLSFRPMLLPDSMELRICVPFDSRSTAWASFDGRGRVELKRGDHIKVTASLYPFPTICSSTQSSDWFHSLSRCLRWNERGRQKAFNIVEHDRPKKTRQTSSATMSPPGPGAGKHNAGSGDNVQLPPSVAMGVKGVSDIPQGRRSRDHSPGPSTSGSGPGLGHGYNPARSSSNLHFSHSYGHVSGHGGHHGAAAAASSSSSGSIGQTRPRHGSVRSTTGSGGAGSGTNQDYFNQSPPNADTMLTCWGTDSCTSSEDSDKTCDDSDSDSLEDKEAAADGDGEWEEDGSSTEESDDDEYCEHVAARGKSTCSQPSCERSGSGGTAAAAAATRTRTALSGTAGTGTGTGSGTDTSGPTHSLRPMEP